jgi:polyisoprenoid-binding protein YceI
MRNSIRFWWVPTILMGSAIAMVAAAADSKLPQTLGNMPAGRYATDNDHTHIYFTYSHVGFSHAHGRFDKFSGEFNFDPKSPEATRVIFTIDPASIDTNVPELDAQLKGRGFFDVANIHEIKFVGNGFLRGSDLQGSLIGDLTMHGVTHPVTLAVRLNKFLVAETPKFNRFGFTATATLSRSQWGLGNVPLVGDEVALEIDVEFTKVI